MEKKWNEKSLAVLMVASILMMFMGALTVSAVDMIRPTIISVSPTNNNADNTRSEQITVVFSEDMNSSSINENTFTVLQRTTPIAGEYRFRVVDGNVTAKERIATFTQEKKFSPSEEYGNVFTVTITSGAKDLAGNSLARQYVWSFTTGTSPFNTGTSTSQSNQNSTPVNNSAVVPVAQLPVVIPPVTGTDNAQATSVSAFPWVWVVGGLLLAVLLASVVILTRRPERQKSIQYTSSEEFGDVVPVIDIEGIGPEYSKRLHAMGIENSKQLWEANVVTAAREIGVSLSQVKSWQEMAELISVKDIGPQYAELLVRSGIHSIDELKNYDPDKLLKLVRKKQDSLKVNIQGNFPGHATVQHWIDMATNHKFGGQEA